MSNTTEPIKRKRGGQPGRTKAGGRTGGRTVLVSANIEPADNTWLLGQSKLQDKPVSEIVWGIIKDARELTQ